jgi:DNA-binding MarR family transcriptional regulator
MPGKRTPDPGEAGKNTKNTMSQKAGQELAEVDFGKLPGYIGYQVRQAQSAVFRDLSRTLRNTGVTPGEFSLLTMLRANPRINSITLTRIYQLDKATLSLSIKGLMERGLISSTRHANDRRYYALELTSAGRTLLQGVTRRIERQERTMDAVLRPGERERLLDLLQRISRAFGR